jgi:predicted lipoprotein with Yx(FWY)xxD motif
MTNFSLRQITLYKFKNRLMDSVSLCPKVCNKIVAGMIEKEEDQATHFGRARNV